MSKRENILEIIVDTLSEKFKEQEKGFLVFLETLYDDQFKLYKHFLSSLFEQLSDSEGKIYQEDLFKYNREKKIKEEIQRVIKEIEKAERKALQSEMENALERQYSFFFYVFSMLGLDIPYKPLTSKQKKEEIQERWTGESYKESNQKNKETLARNLFNSLVMVSAGGTVLNNLINESKKNFISSIKKTQLIMQTETSRKKNKGTFLATYALDKKIKRFEWVSTLDELTCEVCQKHDRKIYKKESLPTFPAHPRCRCGLNPVLRDIDPTINPDIPYRRARTIHTEPYKRGKGYITSDKNFEEWARVVGIPDLTKAQIEGRKRAYPHRDEQTKTPKLEIKIKTK